MIRILVSSEFFVVKSPASLAEMIWEKGAVLLRWLSVSDIKPIALCG